MKSLPNEDVYKKMLERLEVSIISSKKLNKELRLDAEYFLKENIRMDNKLSNMAYVKIGEAAYVTDGIHTSIDYDPDSGINLISATSPRENVFNLSRGAFISQKAHSENRRTALKENDVVLSTVGTIGNCAVADKNILPTNTDRHVAIIRPAKTINPYFLSTFLLSKYGKNQTLREATGNVQLNLFLYKVKEIKVPLCSYGFQETIEADVRTALKYLREAGKLYKHAQKSLSKALGMPDYAPSKDQISIRCIKDVIRSNRIDAEFYQPKYDLLMLFDKMPTKYLGEIVHTTKSIEPGSGFYGDEGVPFIRVSDVSTMGIEAPPIRIPYNTVPSMEKLYPRKDTILFTKDGSVGIAYKLEEDIEAVTSGALLHFQVKDLGEILPDYLTLVLNSDIVQLQAERDASGAIIQHWKPDDIANVVVPILPLDVQEEISENVQRSFALRRQAQNLLGAATKSVEVAIEQDEETAIKYLEDNLQSK